MTSGFLSPEEAHERPRTTRGRRVGVTVAIAFALTVAAIVLSVAGGARDANLAAAAARMQRALASIDQNGPVLGNPKAPVTVYEFADLQCPFCAGYMQTLFPKLLANDVIPGNVKMVLEPIWLLGSGSRWAAQVTVAAAAQNKMWNYADEFFYNQGPENSGYVTNGFLRQIASDVPGLRVDELLVERSSLLTHARLDGTRRLALSEGVRATPTFIVVRRDGRAATVIGTAKLEDTIDRAVAASGRKSESRASVG
jgi:protein-disulfide isomerase